MGDGNAGKVFNCCKIFFALDIMDIESEARERNKNTSKNWKAADKKRKRGTTDDRVHQGAMECVHQHRSIALLSIAICRQARIL